MISKPSIVIDMNKVAAAEVALLSSTAPAISEDSQGSDELLETLGGNSLQLSDNSVTSSAATSTNRSTSSKTKHITTEEGALKLLGKGVSSSAVAAALGVTQARISQLLSEPKFSADVKALRYKNLQQHNDRDSSYDAIEDKLLAKLERSLAFMVKPGEILNAIKVINGAKRRGQSSPDQAQQQQTIVNILLPAVIRQKFTTNINNQVVKAGEQSLLTMPAANLLEEAEALAATKLKLGDSDDVTP